MPMDSISISSNTLNMSNMDGGSSLRRLSASTMMLLYHFESTSDSDLPNLSLVLWVKLFKAATVDVNGAWRMYLPIEFEDIANVKNEQEFNANQSEDEMKECESESYSSSWFEVNKY
jgi:hypothetical protein